jgi:outer membrane protein OmpA-like peptidoglycan-associated protein
MKFKIFLNTFLFAVLFLVFSCAKISNKQILENLEPELKSKGGYESYLALEYLDFSRKLLLVKDLKASDHFAKKGLNIINGVPYVPENPLEWKADKSRIEELILMQKELEILLNNRTLIYQMPIQMAHLSYLYDCWSSKESKAIFMADELSHCRVNFGKLIDEIQTYLEENKKNKIPDVKIVEPEFSRFEIIFDAENYLLSDKENKAMIEIMDYLNSLKGKFRILITANPDNAMKISQNRALIINRINVVKNYLLKNGVEENSIEERIESEDFPDIIASEDIKNQINRSVGIYVLRGQGDFKPYPLPLLQNLLYKAQVEKARSEQGLTN